MPLRVLCHGEGITSAGVDIIACVFRVAGTGLAGQQRHDHNTAYHEITMSTRPQLVSLAAALLSALLLPGCVFWDIRDGVRDANAQLVTVDASLGQVNAELQKVQSALTRLDTTNDDLKNVQSDLGRLDTTNASLTDVQGQLSTLRGIDQSLTKMDAHLSSLRKTIGRIDGMIPFLDIGDAGDASLAATPSPEASQPSDTPADQNADQKAGDKPAGDTADAKSPTDTPADARSRGPRDALLGAWLRQYPDLHVAIVLLDGNRYIMQRVSGERVRETESGTWKREGATLTLVSEPMPLRASDGTSVMKSYSHQFQIVAQTARSLSLTSDQGGLEVFSKP